MKLLKPVWVHHDEKPIFSVDVHQECQKFATGGQGLDSGRVVIWNLLPVLSEKAELDDSIPKMLCQLDNHLSCVNCVRWSQNGQMLASGSDDKLIMIWRMVKGSSGVFGTGGIHKNAETWKCLATLRGHSGDVLDLAWSPQDRWLASCSIDNTIIVWDGNNFPTMVAMLKGHTGLVKGLSWDPVGKYLASQSDDRSVKIWKTCDWTCSKTITEPFEECGGTTHILRLSWSPDGQYLVSAHAMNGGGPTAQIIERQGWKCDKDFVGHRKAVTCVRFHNSILKRQGSKTQKAQQYCCLAVGSRDRSLSVWMTALQRPLVVIHDLFEDSILDLSWGADKCILMACSGDGTLACLQFSQEELGEPLSEYEKNSLYQRIYGKSITLENGANNNAELIEIPELLNSSQEKLQPPSLPLMTQPASNTVNTFANATNTNGLNASIATGSPHKAISKQLEVRTSDGKRRITPMFIPLNTDVTENASTISPQLSSSSRTTTNATALIGSYIDQQSDCTTQVLSGGNSSGAQQKIIQITDESNKTVISETEKSRLDSRLIKSNATVVEPHLLNKIAIKSFPNKTEMAAPKITAPIAYQASTMGPKLNITNSTKCEFQKTALDHRIHVHNGFQQTPNGLLGKVTAYAMIYGDKLWEMFVGSPIVNLNFCRKYAMLCSLDGSLRLLNLKSGSAVLPVITLATPAIQCAFCPLSMLVGIITDCGILRIWHIEENCRAVLATNCSEIFGKNGSVLQFNITTEGVPLLLFSNGNSYSYSINLQSWVILNTKTDVLMRHGLETTLPKEFQRNYATFPITSVQAAGNLSVPTRSSGIDLNSQDWKSAAKLAFIENEIKLCESLGSSGELKHWYNMYAFQLAECGTEKRLRLVLDELIGNDPFDFKSKSAHILTIPKHDLLELFFNALKRHVKWQRIYMEYQELHTQCLNQNLKMSSQLDVNKSEINSNSSTPATTTAYQSLSSNEMEIA